MKPLNEQAYDHLQKLITDGQLYIMRYILKQSWQRNWESPGLPSGMPFTVWHRKAILILFLARDFGCTRLQSGR